MIAIDLLNAVPLESSTLGLSFANLIATSTMLRQIQMPHHQFWSLNSFRALACHQSIEHLKLPSVPHNWNFEVELISGSYFQKLNRLEISAIERETRPFLPYLGNLADLDIVLFGDPKVVFSALPCLPHLRKLTIWCESYDMLYLRGNDLLQASRHCLKLSELNIGGVVTQSLQDGISDLITEQLVRALSGLEIFSLRLKECDFTEESLVALGKH